ncbi:WD40-repeat-containing domain protein [Trichophaea hybrida]|nr:WD40-repeat-containing domain protein [Trichophaea hybrida]
MLTENLLLATTRTPLENVDAPSVSLYNLHTASAISSLKRSHTTARGLASTTTHIFAQQSDKAVINVYSTRTFSLETTVPFPEPFTVISCSSCGSYLAGGTAGGRVYLWELASARFVATPALHLQKITTLCFNKSGRHLAVGSEDTNVTVWSLALLLDTRGPTRLPERVLDRHIHAITSVAIGGASSGGPSELLVTAGRDRNVITWELHTGQHLRTYMMGGVPLCLALDPAERAVYAGFEEGGIQSVEFHSTQKGSGNEMYDEEFRDMPVTVSSEVWGGDDTAEGRAVLSLAVSYEGNMVVSGNERGEVGVWDVATGGLFKNLCQMKAPLTSLQILSPVGFANSVSTKTGVTIPVLPKPRYESILGATSSQTFDTSTYVLSVSLPSPAPETATSPLSTTIRTLPTHTFGPENDMEVILQGAQEMKAFKPALAGKQKVEALESELASLYESYERLAEVHKKTWAGMVDLALKNGEMG